VIQNIVKNSNIVKSKFKKLFLNVQHYYSSLQYYMILQKSIIWWFHARETFIINNVEMVQRFMLNIFICDPGPQNQLHGSFF